ncbi:MAG: biotin transporter BioY [Bifidobacteriaceae bacterium]|nr:biotin transporter BioY [Bifidobacteriaceae bacterium]
MVSTDARGVPRGGATALADLAGRSLARDLVQVVAGAAWVAALGQIAVPLPFTPVPLSLGTFAVLTAGAALGSSRGAAAMGLLLVAGVAGAPVFAGGGHGIGLPTMGYVLGYALAAAIAGRATRRGAARSYVRDLVWLAGASAAVYAVGAPYLAVAAGLGAAEAVAQGVAPFLVGDLLKAAVAAGVLPAARLVVSWGRAGAGEGRPGSRGAS